MNPEYGSMGNFNPEEEIVHFAAQIAERDKARHCAWSLSAHPHARR